MGVDETLKYRAARTVVRVSGAVTVHTRSDGTKAPERVCDVAIATEADPDPDCSLELVIEEKWGTDREFELKLTDDGRLSGVGYTTTGVGAKIVEAGVRLGTIAAKLAAPVFGLVAEEVLAESPVDRTFRAEQAELARRRDDFAKTIAGLQDAVIKAAGKTAGDTAVGNDLDRLTALEKALTLARAEAAILEAAFEKWRSERFPDWTQKLVYSIGTEALPCRPSAKQTFAFKAKEKTGVAGELAKSLGVVVARIETETPATGVPDHESIWFRQPRRVQLATYLQEPKSANQPEGAKTFRLRDLTTAWIVDKFSDWDSVPVRSGLFAQHGATVDLGEAGTLTHLTNKEVGAAAGIASALSGAGTAVEESLDQAAKISAAFQPSDPVLAALESQVQRKELEARLAEANHKIATGNSSST